MIATLSLLNQIRIEGADRCPAGPTSSEDLVRFKSLLERHRLSSMFYCLALSESEKITKNKKTYSWYGNEN